MKQMKIKRKIIDQAQGVCMRFGFVIRQSNGYYEATRDIGREYCDKDNAIPQFTLKKEPHLPWSGSPTKFIVDNGKSILEEVVYYSHLTLLKLCKHYEFHSILDIGSHERKITKIFEHIGKAVTTVEIAPGYEADYKDDYLKVNFNEKFDAIWCSQIYEHQRNPGLFLSKIFEDLKEGGVLALTVPFQIDHHVMFGHINLTSPLMLIYHLICAGFDCKDISLKCFNGSIGVILKKKYNGINRDAAFGSLPLQTTTTKEAAALLGEEFFLHMIDSFPEELRDEVKTNYLEKKISSINWGDPI
ncbi:MAG: methyltransferase domain-containing protein [Simkania sp.]|nr:methyltransferase domain-containing protein [Simkania sp.]